MAHRPAIRGTQVGLKNPRQVDTIKAAMRGGVFDYATSPIAGFVDSAGIYHVFDGHHRMAAALELERETGNSAFAINLLVTGVWTDVLQSPRSSRPMPSRTWWGWLRNRIGF